MTTLGRRILLLPLFARFADGNGRIAMNHVDSVDLQYSVREGWLTNLSNAIKADLQLAVLEKSG